MNVAVKVKKRTTAGMGVQLMINERLSPDRPAPICPDFDHECQLVTSFSWCWTGGAVHLPDGTVAHLAPAAGYCPHLMGMK